MDWLMIRRPHYLIDVLLGSTAILVLAVYWWRIVYAWSGRRRLLVSAAIGIAMTILAVAVIVSPIRFARFMPNSALQWTKAIALFISAWTLYSIPIVTAFRKLHRTVDPSRRAFLKSATGAALAAPVMAGTVAFIRRDNLRLVEIDMPIAGLPKDLHGLRIVQLSDIHLSPFLSEATLDRAIGMANETKPNLALVTGDLISRAGDPLDVCLRHVSRLRSDAGTYGCNGNHEIYTNSERYVQQEGAKLGISILRRQNQVLRFGGALLNLTGFDYQRKGDPYLLGAEWLRVDGALNVLLSHNPDVFPVAASKGFDLTMAGHTHGGQVDFEILEHHVNIARFFTPYVYGRYEREGKSIFVTRGIGTVGAPARLGAPPEVALIRLCAS
jgi:predicted MPP superfamily phosphohydrolase